MNRRSLITSAAAFTVAAPFFSSALEAQMPMGEAEKIHIKRTQKVGSLSLLASRTALKKASTPKVLEFANFEVAEQETISDILKRETDPSQPPSGVVIAPTNAEAMEFLDPEEKTMLAQMGTLSGPEFEKQYVSAQILGHQKLLTIQTDYLAVGKNKNSLNVAKLAKGQITEHLKLLNDIETMMS